MSAKLRLALWVTFMVLLLSVMVLVFVLVMNRHSLPEDPAAYLVDVVLDNADDVEYDRGRFEWNEMTVYKRGVYCSFFDENGTLMLSANKEDMDFSDVEFKPNEIRTVSSGGRDFYLYDKFVDLSIAGMWIRGVVLTDSHVGIMDTIVRLTIALLPIILIITFLGALWISSRTFRPIEQIVDQANSINDANDLTDRINLKRGPREMKRLAGAFDRMFERLEKLFEAERQFTSDASHELRTPTAVILAECERAEKKAKTIKEYKEAIEHIGEQGHKMSGLIDELLGITRLRQGTERYPLSRANLSEFTELTAEEFVPEEDKGIRREIDIEEGIECDFNASLMSRAIYNLLQNAYRYGRKDGFVKLSLGRDGSEAILSVEDNGIGIEKKDIDKIWQRFWQADGSRAADSGSGLGLSMIKEIAELHGGRASVTSEPGKGSRFTIRIPISN